MNEFRLLLMIIMHELHSDCSKCYVHLRTFMTSRNGMNKCLRQLLCAHNVKQNSKCMALLKFSRNCYFSRKTGRWFTSHNHNESISISANLVAS